MDTRSDIAVLVLAHANVAVFERLMDVLRHPNIAVFCHVDARADIEPFRASAPERVKFLAHRWPIAWGAYSMIEAELALFQAARAAGPFAAYALISGDSLPLLENDALIEVLRQAPHLLPAHEQRPTDKGYVRFERIYLPDTTIGRFRNMGYAERYLNPDDLPLIERAIRSQAYPLRKALRFFKASQWFAISDKMLSRMFAYLEATPEFEEIFRFVAMSDESFFPTLLHAVDPAAGRECTFMGVDWTRPQRPYTLTSDADFEGVAQAGTVFYRKFSDDGLDLVERVLANRLSLARLKAERRGLGRYLVGT